MAPHDPAGHTDLNHKLRCFFSSKKIVIKAVRFPTITPMRAQLTCRPCSSSPCWFSQASQPHRARNTLPYDLRKLIKATASSTTAEMTLTGDQQQLPAVYKRLVAKRTGASFADVAEVEETPVPHPGPNEVRCLITVIACNGACVHAAAQPQMPVQHACTCAAPAASTPLVMCEAQWNTPPPRTQVLCVSQMMSLGRRPCLPAPQRIHNVHNCRYL